MSEQWTAERIAELRRRATVLRDAEALVNKEGAALPSRGGWSAPLDDAITARDKARRAVNMLLPGCALLSLLDALKSAREERWIAVTPETTPRVGEAVLAYFLNTLGLPRRVRAILVGEKTHPAGDDYPDEWWDEDAGEAWCPAGWYEYADSSEEMWLIPTPSHYMPLPSPPVLP